MSGIIEIQLLQLAAAYTFILVLMIIVRVKGINREKEILLGTVRMTIQLILVGYLLAYIFEHRHPLFTIVAVVIMEMFAIGTIYKGAKVPLSQKLKQIIALSMIFGTVSSLLFFNFVVIGLNPWYDPRYFIPIAGMIVGNSMTGISLGVNRLVDGITTRKHEVEASLMLGATPQMAAKPIVDNAFDAAILPTINSMVGMGVVFLPGMMTGQILSGVSPIIAIYYQIAIMLGIVGSVALTVIMFVQLGYKTFFNKRNQLI